MSIRMVEPELVCVAMALWMLPLFAQLMVAVGIVLPLDAHYRYHQTGQKKFLWLTWFQYWIQMRGLRDEYIQGFSGIFFGLRIDAATVGCRRIFGKRGDWLFFGSCKSSLPGGQPRESSP
jgi:hypothetical protein